MGEIADMMLAGQMCETCGEFLGGTAGYPRQCEACKGETERSPRGKINCPQCGKRVKATGLRQHYQAKHQ